MSSVQMFTYTFPWWASALVILFFVYMAIFGNIEPDFYLPIYHIPMRLLPGIVILVLAGFIMPRVVFVMFPPLTFFGGFVDCIHMGLICGALSLVLSIVTWCIYAVVRPKEKRIEKEG